MRKTTETGHQRAHKLFQKLYADGDLGAYRFMIDAMLRNLNADIEDLAADCRLDPDDFEVKNALRKLKALRRTLRTALTKSI